MNKLKNGFINKLTDFNAKLSNHTSNYILLVIFHIPSKHRNHIFSYKDNIHLLELHTLARSNGVNFENDDDNTYLHNIIKSKYSIVE